MTEKSAVGRVSHEKTLMGSALEKRPRMTGDTWDETRRTRLGETAIDALETDD